MLVQRTLELGLITWLRKYEKEKVMRVHQGR